MSTLWRDRVAQQRRAQAVNVAEQRQLNVRESERALIGSVLEQPELMNELAWRIDVPPEHLEEGRTISSFVREESDVGPLITVHYAEERPEDAFVSIESRGFWFYIDDRDVPSKRTFALVQILLSLTDTSTTARGPVVSITN